MVIEDPFRFGVNGLHSLKLNIIALNLNVLLLYALKRFHVYLTGRKFKILTNCFRFTSNKKYVNPQISRWALFLQNYN